MAMSKRKKGMTAKELLDLKLQLANEFLKNGGLKSIYDLELVQDLIRFRNNDPGTLTHNIRAFIDVIYHANLCPPPILKNEMFEYKSFLQKNNYFYQIKIETEEQVNELLEKYKDDREYIFRGQREASWRLYNTMQRIWICENYDDLLDYATVLKSMVHKCKEQYENVTIKVVGKNHVDTVNDLALLGFLQHHGCPTPLLDWTSCFENALFFATDGMVPNTVVKEISDYVSVYFLKKENVDPAGAASIIDYALKEEGKSLMNYLIKMVARDERQEREMKKHFKDRDFWDRTKIEGSGIISHMCKVDNMLSIPTGTNYYSENDKYKGIVFSLLNSENIKKQKGSFTWNSSPLKPLEVVAFEAFSNGNHQYKFCECYNINKKLVPYIQSRLKELGIEKDTMYPGNQINTKGIFEVVVNDLIVTNQSAVEA